MPTETLPITPVTGPVRGSIRPPGSKSLTNRALLLAALAEGRSRLAGALDSRDTQVMIESLGRLGIAVERSDSGQQIQLAGCAGRPPAASADLDLENSGTSIRFLTAMCCLGRGRYRLDGNPRMRQRPIGDLVTALSQLGADVHAHTGCPPVDVTADRLPGGTADVAGNISSQYLSALLMVSPCAIGPVDLRIAGTLVSRPYVEMTLRTMAAFGVTVREDPVGRFRVLPRQYRGIEYAIEPDASAASYFFAAAAITGGEITVTGLTRDALQGDVRFVDVIERMGCDVIDRDDGITVRGGRLRGIDVDMNAISDTVQTLAAVAVFAEGPTCIRNVAHIRHKETDRLTAVTTELRRLGITVDEQPDGLTIHPGPLSSGVIQTYDDHRMAMSFALLGLRSAGIAIADPGCVSKTYPAYFDDLGRLCGAGL